MALIGKSVTSDCCTVVSKLLEVEFVQIIKVNIRIGTSCCYGQDHWAKGMQSGKSTCIRCTCRRVIGHYSCFTIGENMSL